MEIKIGTTYSRRRDERSATYVHTWMGADGRARYARYVVRDDDHASVAIDAAQYAVTRLLEIANVPEGFNER